MNENYEAQINHLIELGRQISHYASIGDAFSVANIIDDAKDTVTKVMSPWNEERRTNQLRKPRPIILRARDCLPGYDDDDV